MIWSSRFSQGLLWGFVPALLVVGGCATTESHRAVEAGTVAAAEKPYTGPRFKMVIGKFANKSSYMNGLFSDGSDRVGMQGRQILKTHLTNSQRFRLLERANREEVAAEAELAGATATPVAGEILITGAVTEFGRKEVGTRALGGVLGKSKTQIAYGKVALSVVDVGTSEVLYSSQGAGEFELTNQQVLGFGSAAGYDATLTDKVLNLAIVQALDKMVADLDGGVWTPTEAES